MSIALRHHVYSSLGGYRTLYLSPDMPADLAKALDLLAPQVYRRDFYACLRPDATHVCLVRAYQNGTDHAGRIRRCVHSVVFSLADAAGDWFVSPLAMPDGIFLSPEAPLQSLKNELVLECEPPAPKLTPFKRDLSHECLLGLASTMMSDRPALVLDLSGGAAFEVMRRLSWCLPPKRRLALTLSAGEEFAPAPGLGGARVAVMDKRHPAAEGAASRAEEVVEFPSGDSAQPLAPNPYAEFVASNAVSEKGLSRLAKLAGLIERYPPQELDWDEDSFDHLMSAFSGMESDIHDHGAFDVARDPLRALASIDSFVRSGMERLAVDILAGVSSHAISRYGMDGAAMLQTLDSLRSGAVEPERMRDVLVYLAGRLQELLTSAPPKRSESKTVWFLTPESEEADGNA